MSACSTGCQPLARSYGVPGASFSFRGNSRFAGGFAEGLLHRAPRLNRKVRIPMDGNEENRACLLDMINFNQAYSSAAVAPGQDGGECACRQ
jgi:hypothetical protein